jgi:hypothetical protein
VETRDTLETVRDSWRLVEISRETLETRWRYIGEIGDEYTVWWLMVRWLDGDWGLGTGDSGFEIQRLLEIHRD